MKMLPLALFGLGLGFLIARGKGNHVATTPKRRFNITDPSVVVYSPIVQALAIIANIPWQYVLAWLSAESGGNMCAIGEPGKNGPDGNPKELGLFQLYNPDDLKALGATGKELRAYCVPGTQRLSRKATPEEMGRQVKLGIALIQKCQKDMTKRMLDAGITWPTTSRDYWAMVKLPHALVGFAHTIIPQVVAKLGRPPTSWREFRSTVEEIQPLARFNPALKKQNVYWRALNNCEQVASFIPEGGVS